MKLTIIPIDKAVYKDGLCYSDLSLVDIPSDVHALQWDNNVGHIEYKSSAISNETINELPKWANDALVVWQQAYDADQAIVSTSPPPETVLNVNQTIS